MTKRTAKAENNLFEANLDEKLQLSVLQQLVVIVPTVPGIHIAEHAFVLVVNPSRVLLIFLKTR